MLITAGIYIADPDSCPFSPVDPAMGHYGLDSGTATLVGLGIFAGSLVNIPVVRRWRPRTAYRGRPAQSARDRAR